MEGEIRSRKFLEKFNLNFEKNIASTLQENKITQSIITNPNSQILIVGDPNFAMVNYLSKCHFTIIEGDGKVYKNTLDIAKDRGINLVNSVYPLDHHESKYHLIILKNILHSNKSPEFLSGALKDLIDGGVVCISEPILLDNKVRQSLKTLNLSHVEKNITGGTVFMAQRR